MSTLREWYAPHPQGGPAHNVDSDWVAEEQRSGWLERRAVMAEVGR